MARRSGHPVQAEGTVVNALKSWAELRAYMEQKDRLFPPDALDLYGFLQNGTSWTLPSLSLLEVVL